MALRKAGVEVAVYETREDSAQADGGFLTVATNGIDALRTLDADRAVTARGFPTTAMVLWSGTGKRLGTAEVSITLDDGTTGQTVKRGDLSAALHDEATACGIPIHHGRRLVSVERDSNGVRASFADGTQASADILVGCDGVHSTVRRIIDPDAPAPVYAGLLNLGGYVRGVPVDADPGTYHMIFGKRAFFGYALAPDGEVWWFANLPEPREPAKGTLAGTDTAQWRQRLLDLFAEDVGPATRLVESTTHALTASPIHTVNRLPTWHTDHIVVIGDAAHAPSPSSGQGASLSIEDAVQLAKCLRDAPDAGRAFGAFERIRRARVEPIIKRAARVNNSKAATGIARVGRDLTLPLILRLMTGSKQAQQLFAYHVGWNE
jgi:2-polyprenyl-6-methoxyphenol hydroxylase-like FAD-dependent oxidoreductase